MEGLVDYAQQRFPHITNRYRLIHWLNTNGFRTFYGVYANYSNLARADQSIRRFIDLKYNESVTRDEVERMKDFMRDVEVEAVTQVPKELRQLLYDFNQFAADVDIAPTTQIPQEQRRMQYDFNQFASDVDIAPPTQISHQERVDRWRQSITDRVDNDFRPLMDYAENHTTNDPHWINLDWTAAAEFQQESKRISEELIKQMHQLFGKMLPSEYYLFQYKLVDDRGREEIRQVTLTEQNVKLLIDQLEKEGVTITVDHAYLDHP